MDVISQPLGSEGRLDMKLEGGKVVLMLSHIHASGELSFVVKEDAKYFLEKLKGVIPGNWDDLVINVLEGALP